MQNIIISLLFFASALSALGPKKIAVYDRSLWPYQIKDIDSFNKASRYEIIQFVKQIDKQPLNTVEDIKNLTGLKKINKKSVDRWSEKIRFRVFKNFTLAQKTCVDNALLCAEVKNWDELVKLSKSEYIKSQNLDVWNEAAEKFYCYYLYEKVRLASLFPRISSAIDFLDEREELGVEYEDLHFLLSFDDGPRKNRTQKMTDKLRELDIHGLFFVLGENLEKHLNKNGIKHVQELYSQECVGSHGFVHRVHPDMKDWKTLYEKTRELIVGNDLQGTAKNSLWFRPPYGERNSELIEYVYKKDDGLMLWSIDSLDWNTKLSAKDVQDRVETLMLLYRRGIILFHDVHTKALPAVSYLNEAREKGIINWVDCRNTEMENKGKD